MTATVLCAEALATDGGGVQRNASNPLSNLRTIPLCLHRVVSQHGGNMKTFSVRAMLILAALSLGAAMPVTAQNRDFYRMQYNSTVTDFNKLVDRINELKTGIKAEHDFARGCSMLGSLISYMADAQILTEKLADYAYRLDDMDNHRQAVDQHNAYLEERHFWEGERSRLCQ